MKTSCLIIDDHQLFNDGLTLILKESSRFDVLEQVTDSRLTYTKCLEKRPELVIVDYNMPFLNGTEVITQLKELPFLPKIVVVSMYADQREIEQFERSGIDGYFPKTIASCLLIEYLTQIMEGEKHFEYSKKTVGYDERFQLKKQLTKRELDVLFLLKEGFTTIQMAEKLGLSYYTIETHRKNINQKMKFVTKRELYDFLENFL
ncbi:MAG: response regulator [Spirosomataceae bacterium]